jgi:hypothetical protein
MEAEAGGWGLGGYAHLQRRQLQLLPLLGREPGGVVVSPALDARLRQLCPATRAGRHHTAELSVRVKPLPPEQKRPCLL